MWCYFINTCITDLLSRPPTSLPFTAIPGLNTGLPHNASPLQYLELFLTVGVWQYILQTTNNYAAARLHSTPPRRRSVFCNWRDISLVEIKAFVGIIIQMGLVQLSDIKDYWSTFSRWTSHSSGVFFPAIDFSRSSGCCMWGKHQATTNGARFSLLLISSCHCFNNIWFLLKSSPLMRRWLLFGGELDSASTSAENLSPGGSKHMSYQRAEQGTCTTLLYIMGRRHNWSRNQAWTTQPTLSLL